MLKIDVHKQTGHLACDGGRRALLVIFLYLALGLVVAGCGSEAVTVAPTAAAMGSDAAEALPTQTPQVETPTPEASPTSQPTATPSPTATPAPQEGDTRILEDGTAQTFQTGSWITPEDGEVNVDGTMVWDAPAANWRSPQEGDVYTNAEGQQLSFDAGSGEWVDVGEVRWNQGSLQVWDSELSGFQAVSVPEEMRALVESMFGTENVTWSVDESGVKVHVANPGHVDNPAVYDQTLQLVVRGSEGLEYNLGVIFEPDYLGIGPALVELGEWVEHEGEYRYPNESYGVQGRVGTDSNSTGSSKIFEVNNVVLGGARVDRVVVAAEAGVGLTPTGRAEMRFLAGPGWESGLLVYNFGGVYYNHTFRSYDAWTPPVGTAFGRVYFGGGVSGEISGQMQYMGYDLRRGTNNVVFNVKGRLAALGAGEQVEIGPGVGLESMYTSRY